MTNHTGMYQEKIVMIKPGDILKLKYRGIRSKFRVLGPTDMITSNCIQRRLVDFQSTGLCYDEVLMEFSRHVNHCIKSGRPQLILDGFHPAGSCEDMVCDEHLHRIYLERQ